LRAGLLGTARDGSKQRSAVQRVLA